MEARQCRPAVRQGAADSNRTRVFVDRRLDLLPDYGTGLMSIECVFRTGDGQKAFSEEPIIKFRNEAEAGVPVKERCRRHGFTDASF